MGVIGSELRDGERQIPAEIRFAASLPEIEYLALTVLELDLVAPQVFARLALAVADDLRLPDLLPVMPALRFHRLLQAAVAAIPSQWACAGTSGHARPPYKQRTPQSQPSASDLPAADDRIRPCWNGAYACHTRADLV